MTDSGKLARVFRALSVDTRPRIIQLLEEDTLCISALGAPAEVTCAAVSQRLRDLTRTARCRTFGKVGTHDGRDRGTSPDPPFRRSCGG